MLSIELSMLDLGGHIYILTNSFHTRLYKTVVWTLIYMVGRVSSRLSDTRTEFVAFLNGKARRSKSV